MIDTITQALPTVGYIILAIAYIGVFITIILDNRDPNKTFAYILLLIFLPIAGLVVFYFFGRDYRKRKIFNLKGQEDRKKLEDYWEKNEQETKRVLNQLEEQVGGLVEPAHMLLHRHQSLFKHGNQVQLLLNGEDKFPEVFKALEAARHHIHLEYYILSDDDVGHRIADILVEKARQGVEVRVITDGVGSSKLGDIPKRLRQAGGQHYPFMPVRFNHLASTNYRNHRKILVIDGEVGFVGGLNMDDRYWNTGKHDLYWRDTHLKIIGPAVNSLQIHFLLGWQFVSDHSFPLSSPYFNIDGAASSDGSFVGIVASGPDSDRPHNMDVLISAINRARRHIRITNPYFIPSEPLSTALQIAAASGIEVECLFPGVSDSMIVKHASFSYLKPLLESGVKVYLYDKGFVHAKTMTIDGKLSVVGTVNMDIRSFYINFEVAAVVYDQSLASQLEEAFEADLQEAAFLDPETWTERPLWRKSAESVCRLLTPLL